MHEQVLPWLLIKTKFKTKISCEKTMTLLVNLNEIKTSDLRVIVFCFFLQNCQRQVPPQNAVVIIPIINFLNIAPDKTTIKQKETKTKHF